MRRVILVVLLYGDIALLWLFGVPQLMGLPFSVGSRVFYPELAYGWITGMAIGVGWSVIHAAMTLKASRA